MSWPVKVPAVLAEVVRRIYAKTRPEGGCLVTTGSRNPKTGYATQSYGGRGGARPAHILLARFYLGPRPPGMQVRHLCGRGQMGCVTASHLAYGTPQDNSNDKLGHGTHGVRLDVPQVKEIKALLAAGGGVSLREIASRYGISACTVGDIKHGRTWRNV